MEVTKNGNILVLTQWSFKDALVQTYTLPYVEIIRKIVSKDKKIILVTAEQPHIALTQAQTDAANKEWGQKKMLLIPIPYYKFGLIKLFKAAGQFFNLYRLVRKEKVKTIHAFCTPAGSIAYFLSLFTGASLVIDSYEPHAESMVENGTWKKSGIAFNILNRLEAKQSKRATALIATTEGMRQYALDRYGVRATNFFVKPACVDLEKFSLVKKDKTLLQELNLENKIVCVYAGKLGGIYLKKEIFDFIKACFNYWKDDFRFLMLTNAAKDEINSEIERAGIPPQTVISKFVYHTDIPKYLSLGDFAINPVKSVPTKKYCTSIKDGEYWAMGLPVIISPNISDDSAIIEKEKTGVVLDFSNPDEIKSALVKIDEMLKNPALLKSKIRSIAEKYRSFKIAEGIYKEIYS